MHAAPHRPSCCRHPAANRHPPPRLPRPGAACAMRLRVHSRLSHGGGGGRVVVHQETDHRGRQVRRHQLHLLHLDGGRLHGHGTPSRGRRHGFSSGNPHSCAQLRRRTPRPRPRCPDARSTRRPTQTARAPAGLQDAANFCRAAVSDTASQRARAHRRVDSKEPNRRLVRRRGDPHGRAARCGPFRARPLPLPDGQCRCRALCVACRADLALLDAAAALSVSGRCPPLSAAVRGLPADCPRTPLLPIDGAQLAHSPLAHAWRLLTDSPPHLARRRPITALRVLRPCQARPRPPPQRLRPHGSAARR
jgi:hypothetical protein